ncbi:TIGR02444 family protein [Marinobacterium sp. D7]|uniref:TIGR02444 family protein n=1 Tax=Marinobacterium ramblicola TaxID=2849041 RepID=UPI001C2D10D3|nr:TIGR02444 family protein [Marinobacterium ramblicola]
MSLNNPLWQTALRLYAVPGVEQAALELQRAGCSINRMLLACYLAQQGRRLVPALLIGEALEWQQALTHPLRELRYRVRARKAENEELEPCYRAFRQAELACEQVELMLLWDALSALELPTAEAGEPLARRNLEQVLVASGVSDPGRFDAELSLLIGATLADPLASG